MAIELAAAYVSIVPEMKGASRAISNQLGGVNLTGTGAKLGKSLTGGLGKSVKQLATANLTAPVEAAFKRQSEAAMGLSRAESDLAKKRVAAQSANARVVKAEESLTRLRESGNASSGDLKAAEANLEAAKLGVVDANRAVENSEAKLTKAKESASTATADYAKSVEKSSGAGAKFNAWTGAAAVKLGDWGGQLKNVGGQISAAGATMTSKFTKPVVGAGLAVGGLVGALGFKRLVGIDTARAQFKGLGMDADKVMAEVDKGVTNTALSMAQGASMAVGILATGAVPLDQLESSIKRVANVSAAYNVDSEQAAYLLNNVLTKQKVTWGDLSQMQRNQIPIVTQLADHYGVAADEIMDMAQAGKISVEDLNEVLDKNAGAAAEEYAKSWRGITSNITANLGRIGAGILENIFPDIKDRAAKFLDFLKSDDAKALAEDIGVRLTDAFNTLMDVAERVADWWDSMSPKAQKFALVAGAVVVAIGPVLSIIGKVVSIIGGVMLFASKLGTVFSILGGVIGFLMTPVGLVIAGIALLVAGLVWFFTKTKTGQKIAKKAWEGIKKAVAGVVEWFDTHVRPVLEQFGEFFSALWDSAKSKFEEFLAKIKAVWAVVGEPVMAVLTAAWENFKAVFALVWDTIKNVVETALGVISGIIQTVTALIKGDWDGVWNGIKATFGALWNGIKKQVSNAIKFVGAVIKNGWNLVKNLFSGLGSRVKSTVSSMWESVKTRFKNGVNAAVNLVRNLPKRIKSALSGAKTMLVNVGKDIMRGLRNGIDAGFAWIRSKLQGVGKAIPGWLKKVLGISSPSKVMANEVGKWILPGVSLGVDASESDFRRSVESALDVSDIHAKVPDLSAGPFAALGSGGSAFDASITAMLSDDQLRLLASMVLSASQKIARGEVLDSQWRDRVSASNSTGVE